MHQGVLPIQCEVEQASSEVTARAGLLPYLDMMVRLGLWREANRIVGARTGEQG